MPLEAFYTSFHEFSFTKEGNTGTTASMISVLNYITLILVKATSSLFFKLEKTWISDKRDFKNIKLIMLLNHTSLYEPLFISAAPCSFLWKLARNVAIPVAEKTLKRPVVGFLWKILAPGIIPLGRRRDSSWFKFLTLIEKNKIIIIAPEGRMKRENGLDSRGNPMSVRSGIAEIISEIKEGNILIAYSGGLHHVQHPGELIPRIFQKITLNLELVDIKTYKAQFSQDEIQFRKDIVSDLEERIQKNTP